MITLQDYYAQAGVPKPPDFSETIQLAKTPFPHQVEDLSFLAKYTRSGFYNEAGVGKTLPAQALAIWWVTQGNKVICTMPPTLVPQFRKSFSANYPGIDQHIRIEAFHGDIKQRTEQWERWEREGWPDAVILSFRMFVGKPGASGVQGLCCQEFLEKGYTGLIVDEAHACKHLSSQLHKAVKRFAGPKHASNGVVLMTGSPVENNLEDAYGLVSLVDPTRYGSFRSFEHTHCVLAPTLFRKVERYVNIDYLYESLYRQGRRVLKKDVLDLPPRLITEMEIDLTPEHMRLYRKIVNERVAEIGDAMLDMTAASALYQMSQQILMHPENYTDRPPKENALIETIKDLMNSLSGHKVIVYCWYTQTVEKLRGLFKKLNPAVLYGAVTGAEREEQKAKFISDSDCQVIFANPRSGGLGIDGFQDVCSHVIFAELISVPGVFDQAISRVHRSGQTAQSISVYLLVPHGTVAVKLRNDLVNKESNARQALRDKQDVLLDLLGDKGLQGVLE